MHSPWDSLYQRCRLSRPFSVTVPRMFTVGFRPWALATISSTEEAS